MGAIALRSVVKIARARRPLEVGSLGDFKLSYDLICWHKTGSCKIGQLREVTNENCFLISRGGREMDQLPSLS